MKVLVDENIPLMTVEEGRILSHKEAVERLSKKQAV